VSILVSLRKHQGIIDYSKKNDQDVKFQTLKVFGGQGKPTPTPLFPTLLSPILSQAFS